MLGDQASCVSGAVRESWNLHKSLHKEQYVGQEQYAGKGVGENRGARTDTTSAGCASPRRTRRSLRRTRRTRRWARAQVRWSRRRTRHRRTWRTLSNRSARWISVLRNRVPVNATGQRDGDGGETNRVCASRRRSAGRRCARRRCSRAATLVIYSTKKSVGKEGLSRKVRVETYSGSETAGMTPSMEVTCFGSSSETSQTMILPSAPDEVFEKR